MTEEAGERIAELRQQRDVVREKVVALAQDAREVLREDLPLFALREAKRAFLADPDFAESLSDESIRALKQALLQRAKERAAAIVGQLEAPELWLAGRRYVEGAKSFEDHAELWAIVNQIVPVVRQGLEEQGFPRAYLEGTTLHYQQPKWFISGRLMTTVAEKYWQKMQELSAIEHELEELDLEARRDDLKQRWDRIR